MGTSASRSPQHPSGPSLTKDRAARAAAPSPLPALADGVSSPTQAQPPRRSSKPRGYRASAPDGDSIAMVTATNSSTGGAGVPQQRNYSPMVDGRPTPSAASVSYHPGAPEAKRFLGIFGRKGVSRAEQSRARLEIPSPSFFLQIRMHGTFQSACLSRFLSLCSPRLTAIPRERVSRSPRDSALRHALRLGSLLQLGVQHRAQPPSATGIDRRVDSQWTRHDAAAHPDPRRHRRGSH